MAILEHLPDEHHATLRRLGELVGDTALIQLTETGLSKSILDATGPVRDYLADANFHDYDSQEQGRDHKVTAPAMVIAGTKALSTKATLYRPETKAGDPRLWISGLRILAEPGDVLALFVCEEVLYAFNVSKGVLDRAGEETPLEHRAILEMLSQLHDEATRSASRLLERLKALAAREWIPGVGSHDNAVGLTLEHALGIAVNTSKLGDFEGIEIKASRRLPKGATNRITLFSQVPRWSMSACRSARELLDAFGYERPLEQATAAAGQTSLIEAESTRLQLYHQVDGHRANSLGLQLRYDADSDIVAMDGPGVPAALVWDGSELRERLQTKHAETFWVLADARGDRGAEEFRYVAALHTRRPYVSRLCPLINEGVISLDLTLSARPRGKTRDHGYLFKISPSDRPELFPDEKSYSLVERT